MKNIVIPLGAFLFLGTITAGAIVSMTADSKPKSGSGRSVLPTTESLYGRGPYPELTTDGKTLFADKEPILNVKPAGERSGIKISGSEKKGKPFELEITVSGEKKTHKAQFISSPVWSEQNRSLFFIQTDGDPKDSTNSEYQIWQWSEDKGFHAISESYPKLTKLTIAPNGEVLAAKVEGDEFLMSGMEQEFVLRSLKTKKEFKIHYEDVSNNCVPLSENEVLIDGHNTLGDQTYRWNLRRKKVTPLVQDASIVSVVSLGGKLYGIHKQSKQISVVELNSEMNKFVATYDMPPTVGKRRKVNAEQE